MKPFNKERAIDGDPVITRSGKKVTELKFFNEADYDGISIVEKVKGLAGNCRICHFREDGTYLYNDKDIDLFMAPEKTKSPITPLTAAEEIKRGDPVYIGEDNRIYKSNPPKKIKGWVAISKAESYSGVHLVTNFYIDKSKIDINDESKWTFHEIEMEI